MKKLLRGAMKSKTIWFSIFISVGGAIQANTYFLHTIMGDKTVGYLLLMIGCVSAILRIFTVNALEDKVDGGNHGL